VRVHSQITEAAAKSSLRSFSGLNRIRRFFVVAAVKLVAKIGLRKCRNMFVSL